MISSAYVSFESHDPHCLMDTTLRLMVGGVGAQEEEGALSRILNGTNCIGYGATSIYERGASTLHCP